MSYHNPVLLFESVDGLAIKEDGTYVDVTFGGGGHSKEILKRLGPKGRLFAFDQDEDALKNAIDDPRFVLIHANFKELKESLNTYQVFQVDGILADLGVSSHQFDEEQRGFSTRFDAVLDMRMGKGITQTAFDIVNFYEEEALANVLFLYGELRNSRVLAKSIVAARKEKEIRTSFELKQAIARYVPKAKEHKVLAQVFQAIRIEVNDELEVLKSFLMQTDRVLVPGGKLSVISYHSLEDRLVKRYIRSGMFEGEPERDVFGNYTVPFKKGKLIVPSAEEISLNNRARSAKLRLATRL
ncbi:16S rRNA (cytosine(1402)-N(4))-methyltransferase RsmH [Flavobacteriaceae bacterium F08102]|nr:16S rRNA (cytosine(1402)-N(4))-methyltransferase RsmH [Flavobacteriaceae bacterium F08102]